MKLLMVLAIVMTLCLSVFQAQAASVVHDMGDSRSVLLNTLESRVASEGGIQQSFGASSEVRSCVSMAYLQLTGCLASLRDNGADDEMIQYCVGNHVLVDLEGIRGYEQPGYKDGSTSMSCCGADRVSHTVDQVHDGHRWRLPTFKLQDKALCDWARETWAGTSVSPSEIERPQAVHLGEVSAN